MLPFLRQCFTNTLPNENLQGSVEGLFLCIHFRILALRLQASVALPRQPQKLKCVSAIHCRGYLRIWEEKSISCPIFHTIFIIFHIILIQEKKKYCTKDVNFRHCPVTAKKYEDMLSKQPCLHAMKKVSGL